jgi:excisionase family DNA binding protein
MSTQQTGGEVAEETQRGPAEHSPEVLDADEAGQFLRAHTETVRRLARRGEIPAYKVGKDWRFSRIALRRWTETQHIRAQRSSVLVVDDEETHRLIMRSALEGAGYRVALAARGAEATDLARRERPDLLVLDLKMEGMTGVDVLRDLRSLYPDLPVLVVTGYPDSELMHEALRYPPITLLPKPVEAKVFVMSVERVLQGSIKTQGRQ